MRSLRTVSLTLVLALAAPSLPVHADDTATAEALFKEGKALMEAGKFAEACPKLEASFAYDKSAGGTVLRLAACYQGLKKYASAWGRYNDALSLAKRDKREDRIEAANKGLAEVEPRMSRVTIQVPAAARVPGLVVKLDGNAVHAGAWATATPIDPGSHTLAAGAPGYRDWQTTFSIAFTAESKTVEVPQLELEPKSAVAPTQTDSGGGKVAAYIALGAGVVLIGGGVGMYMKARSERDQYFEDCKLQPVIECEDQVGRSRVRTWETLAYVTGGLGLAAIGVGVTLFVTEKRGDSKPTATRIVAAPTVAATGGGLSVVGEF